MTTRQPWEEVRQAEDVYFAKRKEMFAAGAEEQLRLAMADVRGRGTAMRILKDAPIEMVMELFEPVFARATTTQGDVSLAREVLGRLDSGWLFLALQPVIEARLGSPDADWEDYQRIAEVLKELDQFAHLKALVARAEACNDPDILEVADVYRAVE